ncbi:MAG: 30S ribosomal protein S20 [Candidatus Auribacterota bacterium]
MPNTRSAQKHMRSDARKTLRNKSYKSSVKSALRTLYKAMENNEKDSLGTLMSNAFAKLDKAGKTGVIHPNKANRKKARINRAVNAVLSK